MFIDEKKSVEVKIYYKKLGHNYVAYSEKVLRSMNPKTSEYTVGYNELNLKMKELTWGLYNELQEDAIVVDGMGGRRFNTKLYKENRLRKLILSWDAKITDENGKSVPVPVDNKTLSSLAPEIAECILETYEEIMEFGENDSKK